MLNFCGIVAAILKMVTGRYFSMSGINLGHHNLHVDKMNCYKTANENYKSYVEVFLSSMS